MSFFSKKSKKNPQKGRKNDFIVVSAKNEYDIRIPRRFSCQKPSKSRNLQKSPKNRKNTKAIALYFFQKSTKIRDKNEMLPIHPKLGVNMQIVV